MKTKINAYIIGTLWVLNLTPAIGNNNGNLEDHIRNFKNHEMSSEKKINSAKALALSGTEEHLQLLIKEFGESIIVDGKKYYYANEALILAGEKSLPYLIKIIEKNEQIKIKHQAAQVLMRIITKEGSDYSAFPKYLEKLKRENKVSEETFKMISLLAVNT